jgi:hypothetical protein
MTTQAALEQFSRSPKLDNGQSRIFDQQAGATRSNAIVGVNWMQSNAERFCPFNKCFKPVKTQVAKPNYKMRACLMRTDFNIGTCELLQRPDNHSPTIAYLLSRPPEVRLVLAALEEACERRLLRHRRSKIVHQFGLVQIVAYGFRAHDVPQA